MATYTILENQTHLGDIQANSQTDAMNKAREIFPNRANIRVEKQVTHEDYERANPVSLSETKRAIDGMLGRRSDRKI